MRDAGGSLLPAHTLELCSLVFCLIMFSCRWCSSYALTLLLLLLLPVLCGRAGNNQATAGTATAARQVSSTP
jgi:hypothetical protein